MYSYKHLHINMDISTNQDGNYIRKWIPQLAKYPTKYIYEPWLAPLSIQMECNCIIGEDYPLPIVAHEVVSKENMNKMKIAYQSNNLDNDLESDNNNNSKKRPRKDDTDIKKANSKKISSFFENKKK